VSAEFIRLDPDPDQPEPEATPLCDHLDCGNPLDAGSTSVGGLGWYCSMECADKAEAEFAERMQRRGFQPSGLAKASGE
jgi:hypothetical protein